MNNNLTIYNNILLPKIKEEKQKQLVKDIFLKQNPNSNVKSINITVFVDENNEDESESDDEEEKDDEEIDKTINIEIIF
jgi:hypothetical protein